MLSTQVLWCFAATPHEIATAGVADNIEQHQRRKHSELDNILQIKSWIDGMSIQTKGKLDPSKTVDVLKYALILGNPLNPAFVEPWLLPLLKGAPPTFENKLKAVTDTSGSPRNSWSIRRPPSHTPRSTPSRSSRCELIQTVATLSRIFFKKK